MSLDTENGALVLWHRTAAAAAILANGFRDNHGFILAGTSVELSGVFVSDRPLDASEGAKGRDLLRVALDATEAEIDQYEIKDDEGTYREWCVPAALLNERATVALVDEFADEAEG